MGHCFQPGAKFLAVGCRNSKYVKEHKQLEQVKSIDTKDHYQPIIQEVMRQINWPVPQINKYKVENGKQSYYILILHWLNNSLHFWLAVVFSDYVHRCNVVLSTFIFPYLINFKYFHELILRYLRIVGIIQQMEQRVEIFLWYLQSLLVIVQLVYLVKHLEGLLFV